MDSSPAVVSRTPQESSLDSLSPDVSTIDVSIIDVSIIIPARNEEAVLGDCLKSLATQTGIAFEIIVVDDHSTDRTLEIARSFSGVRVIQPGLLPNGSTGKNNALVTGVKLARAKWFLFTDADTVHRPGSLARAFEEARAEQTDLLSYSPEQIVVTFSERAVTPVIFAELAAAYPPHKVRKQHSQNLPNLETVAANGQYILVRREAYEAVGGHAAVAINILEDVALARLFSESGYQVYFRYAGDAVQTRMYRSWEQLREGWTKNLALLFPRTAWLALRSLFFCLAALSILGLAVSAVVGHHLLRTWFALFWPALYWRISRAHFSAMNNVIAMVFGWPIFAYLLLRSREAHKRGQIAWKGRHYNVDAPEEIEPANGQAISPVARMENQTLRTGN